MIISIQLCEELFLIPCEEIGFQQNTPGHLPKGMELELIPGLTLKVVFFFKYHTACLMKLICYYGYKYIDFEL